MAEDEKKEGEQKAEEQKVEERKVEQKGGGPGPEEQKSKPVAEQKEEELFDVIVLPGTPRSVLRDVVKKFPVQLVERKIPLHFANMEGDEREILAFRGPRKVVEEVEQFIEKELKEFVETGGWRKEKGDTAWPPS